MGIPLFRLHELRDKGLLQPGAHILDIGSANLYQAEKEELRCFFDAYGVPADAALIDRIVQGSLYFNTGGVNGIFVGELLEMVGLSYRSFDIAQGYKTQIFDLNAMALPRELKGRFDTVLNYGTTEHVMNQHNAMRVMHDAVRPGGHIVHEVPAQGFIDHGYICYTPRFFFDLAGHNEYEVVDFGYLGPSPGKPIMNVVRDYSAHFPVLQRYVPAADIGGYTASDVAISIIYKKVKDMPFRSPMETSTSVGKLHIPSLAESVAKSKSLVGRLLASFKKRET
jgi:SAM-dependent methyltransferase